MENHASVPRQARAIAPASIGNIAVGFDILGHAFNALSDQVLATREAAPGVRLGTVSGLVSSLPDSPQTNTALAAAEALLHQVRPGFGARLDITKGIPLSAGLGGSAASAVAGVAAVNALLPQPLKTEDLLPFALMGEAITADPPAWDNVMPSLLGGLVMAASTDPALVRSLPAPKDVVAVLVHPDRPVETQAARALLSKNVLLATAVEHARRLSAFTLGCVRDDEALIKAGLEDILIEPQRAHLVPGFAAVKAAALEHGALGCSLSGSGPSIFAWVNQEMADTVAQAMADAFKTAGLDARRYRASITGKGVQIETR